MFRENDSAALFDILSWCLISFTLKYFLCQNPSHLVIELIIFFCLKISFSFVTNKPKYPSYFSSEGHEAEKVNYVACGRQQR